MIPINDTEPNRFGSLPLMTLSLIFINTAVLIWELIIPRAELSQVFFLYGFVPNLVWTRVGAGMLSSLTAIFLHGGISHLLGNMIFLWVFGRRVEDACGALRFLLYYLLAGVCGGLLTAVTMPTDTIPNIGASGAIAGLIGAYLILYPGGRIRTFFFIPFTPLPVWPKLPAFVIALLFLAEQIVAVILISMNQGDYNVGYWAHLGGFFTCIFIFFFLRPEAFARYWSDTVM